MNFLYIPAVHQLPYTSKVRELIPAEHKLLVKNSNTTTLLEVNQTIRHLLATQQLQVHGLIISDLAILKLLLKSEYGIQLASKDEANLQNYAGALFQHTVVLAGGVTYKIPAVIIQNPEPLAFAEDQRFLTRTYISKLYDRSWFQAPQLDWTLLTEETCAEAFKLVNSPAAILISIDIETTNKEVPSSIEHLSDLAGSDGTVVPSRGMWYHGYPQTKGGNKSKTRIAALMPIITCVGYTVILKTPTGSLVSKTFVIPCTSYKLLQWIRKFNMTAAPKVMQNGRYDCSYFLRFNAPVHNWIYDTYGMMHSWMVELPRDLAAISALTLRNHMYWKDESGNNIYEYNAKDCHATAWACLVLLTKLPNWAVTNYVGIFKQVFPCISCGLEGFRQDTEEAVALQRQYAEELVALQSWWDKILVPHFNVNSPPQVKQLFQGLLRTGVTSCDKISLHGVIHKHPLWRMIITKLLDTRKKRKADATYLNVITFVDRILFELDPFGTETGRYASKSSNFWCGTQIQNIPGYAKSMFMADKGYLLQGIDNSQSESRTTAYITGDTKLIDAVETAPDFHTRNASLFFGIPESQLFAWKKSAVPAEQKLFKTYRNDIGKRVNHGANYNMGPAVLIDTMTPEKVIAAKHTLKLPGKFTLMEVAKHLLSCFDAAYPTIRSVESGGYHYQVVREVADTGKLRTPDNWTRLTFLKPGVYIPETDSVKITNKVHLNALVAHKPQSWSVRCINRAFFDFWLEYQIKRNMCRVKAQVHDEIIFQSVPENLTECTAALSALMRRPNKMYDAAGVEVGEMVIPNEPGPANTHWHKLKN